MAVIDRRIGLLFLAFVGLLAIALTRATYLGAIQAGSLHRAAVTQQVTQETVPAPRGTITDRNGVELAISEAADDIAADPYLIKDPATASGRLAPLLAQPQLKILAALTKPHTGFVYLAHLVPADRAAAINTLNIAGISLIPETKRVYPRSWAASQMLGTVGWGSQGLSGLEYLDNGILRGSDGVRKVVSDAIGQPISIDNLRATKPGRTLQLTIDAALQDEVEQVLAGVGATYSPRGATAIVMNPNTGEILALANWPRINANDPSGAPSYASEDRAVGFNYEPGSTFKAITVAGALQEGLVTPSTLFDVPPVLQVADRQIHDAESHGYETLSVAQILKFSSNIGADEIGARLGAQRFDYWVHRFGFGALTRVDLPGEEQGIVRRWWQYSGSSMGNLPIGQGESVTPIQMATAYAAIANGGILRSPHIVKAVGGKPTALPAGRRVISQTTAAELRDMLQGVLADGGTASGAAIPGYDMAGKTGTANEVVNGVYSSTDYAASFIGFVPTQHPQLLVAVMVDRPQGAIYGGAVAAPAFQKIVGWAVPYFGISPR
ncbi:MAG: penicillin-binding protein 2 [Solirubrobacterales bacterium]|nr:penicillin-binding protein 2 [Solirubrobacterales bacterium]MBV9425779.1 penicillin-binding protein 2 [Solirubrobacterales bacterium]